MQEYTHRNQTWRLFRPESGHLTIVLPETSLTLPAFVDGVLSQTQAGSRHHQTVQSATGWYVRIEVYLENQTQTFALVLGKEDFAIRYQDAPSGLCLDLLEMLAETSGRVVETEKKG